MLCSMNMYATHAGILGLSFSNAVREQEGAPSEEGCVRGESCENVFWCNI
jgi:hypothetical protein